MFEKRVFAIAYKRNINFKLLLFSCYSKLSTNGGRKKINLVSKSGSRRTLLPRNGFIFLKSIKLGSCHANLTPQRAPRDTSFFVGFCRVLHNKEEVRNQT